MNAPSSPSTPSRQSPSSGTIFGVAALLIVCFLLVVFVIPQTTHDRQYARRAACQSNLHALAAALLLYSDDYEGRLPLIRSNGFGNQPPFKMRRGPVFGWADTLLPYLKSNEIYRCPSDPTEISTIPRAPGYTSYYFNTNLNVHQRGLALSQLRNSATTLLLGEGHGGNAYYNRRAPDHQTRSAGWLEDAMSGSDTPDTRHLGSSNYAFCDGHVKSLKASAISQGAIGIAQSPSQQGFSQPTFAPY